MRIISLNFEILSSSSWQLWQTFFKYFASIRCRSTFVNRFIKHKKLTSSINAHLNDCYLSSTVDDITIFNTSFAYSNNRDFISTLLSEEETLTEFLTSDECQHFLNLHDLLYFFVMFSFEVRKNAHCIVVCEKQRSWKFAGKLVSLRKMFICVRWKTFKIIIREEKVFVAVESCWSEENYVVSQCSNSKWKSCVKNSSIIN